MNVDRGLGVTSAKVRMLGRGAIVAPLVAMALTMLSREARADDERGVLDSRHHTYESPQNFAFEIRFARYTPNIDSAFNGQGPYERVFGTMPRLEVGAELDWQVVRIPHFGTVGPGISAGYTSMSAPASFADGSGVSAEDTSLDILPLYAVGVLRVDVFSREARVPIVPYVKFGVGLAFWRAYNDSGTSQSRDGVSGKGHSTGTHFAVGAALTLDPLDASAARSLDTDVGVNHTYLFVEYFRSDMFGIGQSNALDVGTSNIAGGLAFEF